MGCANNINSKVFLFWKENVNCTVLQNSQQALKFLVHYGTIHCAYLGTCKLFSGRKDGAMGRVDPIHLS